MSYPSFCLEYDFEIDRVVNWLRSGGYRKVLIQLPPALMRCFSYIYSEIESQIENVILTLSANPSYGSCLVDEVGARAVGAEALVHFGHLEYPFYSPSIPVLYIPLEWRGANIEWLAERIEEVCRDVESCCVVTTAQHLRASRVASGLARARFVGLILGCYAPPAVASCDKVVVIAGGDFHCVSAALMTSANKVICIDPYERNVKGARSLVEKILRVRLWKISKCINARHWLVIDGVLGQHRSTVIDRIRSALSSSQRIHVAVAYNIDKSTIRNIDPCSYDCIVVAACPRIAIDDLSRYEKPVLTPGEALMALEGRIDRYVYPW